MQQSDNLVPAVTPGFDSSTAAKFNEVVTKLDDAASMVPAVLDVKYGAGPLGIGYKGNKVTAIKPGGQTDRGMPQPIGTRRFDLSQTCEHPYLPSHRHQDQHFSVRQ